MLDPLAPLWAKCDLAKKQLRQEELERDRPIWEDAPDPTSILDEWPGWDTAVEAHFGALPGIQPLLAN